MDKETTVCFQTTSEISNALEKIAAEENLSISEVVNIIINRHIKADEEFTGARKNRRRVDRKKVDIPAYLGDPRWQRHDFEAVHIEDISIAGIRFTLPKGTKLEVHPNSEQEKDKFIIIFRLPNYNWPIKVQIAPQRVCEFSEAVEVGAVLVDPDFHAYTAIQKYMI